MNPEQIYPDIYRITLPLSGKKPGPVNVYLFRGEGGTTTLLDAGTAPTAPVLERCLKTIGLTFSGIDRIVLTHGHVDHYGAASRVLEGGGGRARVYVHTEDARAVETGIDVSPLAYQRFLRITGIPMGFQMGIIPLFVMFRKIYARRCPVHGHLHHGDMIRLGRYTARVIETPGHTRGSVCFFLEEERLLFSGDHVLGHITPNAFPMLEETCLLPRRLSQKEFYASLDRIRALGPCRIYPAHGQPIPDFAAMHQIYRACFAERQALILETIRHHPGQSVYAMARTHFPDITGPRFILDLYLAVSEIFTHIQVLEDLGRVRTRLVDNVLHVEYVK